MRSCSFHGQWGGGGIQILKGRDGGTKSREKKWKHNEAGAIPWCSVAGSLSKNDCREAHKVSQAMTHHIVSCGVQQTVMIQLVFAKFVRHHQHIKWQRSSRMCEDSFLQLFSGQTAQQQPSQCKNTLEVNLWSASKGLSIRQSQSTVSFEQSNALHWLNQILGADHSRGIC